MCVKFLLISRVIGTVLKGQKSSFNNILDCYFTNYGLWTNNTSIS